MAASAWDVKVPGKYRSSAWWCCEAVQRGGAVLVEDSDRPVFSQLPPDPDLDARHDLHLLVKGRSNHKSDADRGAVGWRKNQTCV